MAYDQKKKKTRKERFLGEMDAVLPWDLLLAPILEHYPKAGGGRRPIGAPVMLRIYFMQQWYGLSDPAMEDSLYDVESMRRFAGVDLGGVPDETTICKFRHLLEAHGLTEALFDQTKRYLSDRGHDGERRHHRGCDDHPCAVVDEEQEGEKGPRDGLTRRRATPGTSA